MADADEARLSAFESAVRDLRSRLERVSLVHTEHIDDPEPHVGGEPWACVTAIDERAVCLPALYTPDDLPLPEQVPELRKPRELCDEPLSEQRSRHLFLLEVPLPWPLLEVALLCCSLEPHGRDEWCVVTVSTPSRCCRSTERPRTRLADPLDAWRERRCRCRSRASHARDARDARDVLDARDALDARACPEERSESLSALLTARCARMAPITPPTPPSDEIDRCAERRLYASSTRAAYAATGGDG